MAKQRLDILERTRELMSEYDDREIVPNINDVEQHENAMQLLNKIEKQLRTEFGVQRSTVRNQIATVVSERRKPHMKYDEQGWYIDFDE